MADTAQNTGQFSKVIVTNAGKEMIAKSQNGQVLRFTRVALGDGLIDNGDDPVNFTAVKNERLSADIAKFTNQGNGQFEIQFRVSNQTVETGFWHREIGVMAQIDEGEEQLYAYTTSGNKASFLYDKTTPIEERIVNMAFIIGNAANVQVVINSSVIYTTIDDVNDYIGAHNATAASHAAAFAKQFAQHNVDVNAHEIVIEAHNTNTNAHAEEFAKYLPLAGGTTTGLVSLAQELITNLATNIPTGDDSGKLAPTAWVRIFVNNILERIKGKTTPTLTPLIDWNQMKTINKNVDVRTIKNTTTGIIAYGGDSVYLNNGDIILKQSFDTFDALLFNYTNDAGEVYSTRLISMWQFIIMMNSKAWFDLPQDRYGEWLIYGLNASGRKSTATRLNIVKQNSGVIEIYGVTY